MRIERQLAYPNDHLQQGRQAHKSYWTEIGVRRAEKTSRGVKLADRESVSNAAGRQRGRRRQTSDRPSEVDDRVWRRT